MAHIHDGKKAYVRASSLDAVAKCPAMPAMCEGEVNANSDATELGQAMHKIMEDRGLDKSPDLGPIDSERAQYVSKIAELYRVPVLALDTLARGYTKNPLEGPEYCHQIHSLSVERTVELRDGEDLLSVGHCDLTTVYTETLTDGDHEHVLEALDYKTGDPRFVTPPDESLQVQCYAVAAAEEASTRYTELVGAYATIDAIKMGTEKATTRHYLDREEWPDVKERIKKVVHAARAEWDLPVEKRTFRTGDHCSFCSARHKCPAANADLKTVMALEGDSFELTADVVPELFQMASRAVRAGERAKQILKEYVAREGAIRYTDAEGVPRVLEERKTWVQPFLSPDIVAWAGREIGLPESKVDALLERLEVRPEAERSMGLRAYKDKSVTEG